MHDLIDNATPYGLLQFPSVDKHGRELFTVCVGVRCILPERSQRGPIERDPEAQPPPPMADEYLGDPAASSLRREGQLLYVKPTTEIHVYGAACAPRSRPTTERIVRVRIGNVESHVLIVGDRIWDKGITGLVMSDPVPFERIPLVYERAFGGVARTDREGDVLWEPRNPIGCGLYRDAHDAAGKAVPNFEDPRARIRSLSDRPTPIGLGPIPRSWQPRIAYAGTYDQTWLERRAPLYPHDFDERFFQGAAPGLICEGYLRGDEHVVLEGLTEDGLLEFDLPRIELHLTVNQKASIERVSMNLDTIEIDLLDARVNLYYRKSFPLLAGLEALRNVRVW